MRIGVLAVQGAFAEHMAILDAIGVEGVEVRLPSDLLDVSGLILPGGESTAQRRLIDRWGLREPIMELARSGAGLEKDPKRSYIPDIESRSQCASRGRPVRSR